MTYKDSSPHLPGPVPAVGISDRGDGVFAIRVADGDRDHLLTHELAGQLARAVESVGRRDAAKVLLLEGGTHAFLHGGRQEYNGALAQQLFQALADFPYPVIAVVRGDASGPGLLAAALCDFMVWSRDARLRYTRPEAGLLPTATEDRLFAERFGRLHATDFLYHATGATGAQLHERGWTCAIVDTEQVEPHARRLAANLAAKSQDSLRLLKQHLAQRVRELAQPLAAVEPASLVDEEAAPAGAVQAAPALAAGCLELEAPAGGVLLVRIRAGSDAAAVTKDLRGLFETAGAEGAPYRALVLASEHPDFLPQPSPDAVAALAAVLRCAALPLVAILGPGSSGKAWLIGQFCDAAVYAAEGTYCAADLLREPAWTALAAPAFAARLGGRAAREIVLAGAAFAGTELRHRLGPLPVAAHCELQAEAVALAAAWSRWPRGALALRSLHEPAMPASARLAHGQEQEQEQEQDPSGPGVPIALASPVIRAQAWPDGVVLVRMEDRNAKNLFSREFVQGMDEVFRHIDATPGYKAVVLTGYDKYFASGGTREALEAIQDGRAKFTDQQVYLLALECKLPVVAAMQGHGIGGGLSLGLFADFVLLGEESKYLSPYMGYGFTPGAGATLIVPAVLGRDLGTESLLSAQESSGSELRERGLRHPVYPRAGVLDAAIGLARQLARHPRESLVAAKACLNRAIRDRLEHNTRQEISMHERTFVGHAGTLKQIQANFNPMDDQKRTEPAAAEAAQAKGPAHTLESVGAAIRQLLAQELHMAPADIDEDTPFVDLGLDSITGVTWVRKINDKYGTAIQATKVYSHPTLAQLGVYVLDEIAKEGAAAPAMDAPTVAAAAAATVAATPVQADQRQSTAPPQPQAQVRAAPDTALARRAKTRLVSWRDQQPSRTRAAAGAAPLVEPVAVIGMAGQFPQAATLARYWDNIAQGRNCVSEIPPQRWDLDSFYREGDPTPGKTNSKWMGHLEEFDLFDPLFFDISPKEAMSMDPQQRVFLQAAWHAIEDAGYNPRSLSGSRCGVFVGCGPGDYHLLSRDLQVSALGFTGGDTAILAARVSYLLNLQGPCLSIQTACSSSLVAIATACDSLAAGNSDLALAGGVGVMTGPELHVKMAQTGMLSPDGRCFTFDQRANGFAPGEGVGAVLLKRLSDAQRDQDRILGVIRGWGVNQDGKTNGITAPNPDAQTRLQQGVYERFGIDPSGIQLVEAHGTGTKLGDPIEVDALKRSFAKYKARTACCALGSVKSNIGHCFTAAGVASVIKVLLAMQHRQLPPTINHERLNEHIALEGSPFYVNTRLQPWEPGAGQQRMAAINGFGFGGTNAHLVIADYAAPATPAVVNCITEDGKLAFPLSAKTAAQLEQKARDMLAFLAQEGGRTDLASLAYTLQVGREAMDERLGVMAGSAAELAHKLQAWLDGEPGGILQGRARDGREATSLLRRDADLRETIIDRLVAQRQLSKLLDLWIKDLEFDWHKLYGSAKPRRMALPVYPFAKERYWVDGGQTAPAAAPARTPAAGAAALHPLLHQNTSNLRQLGYSALFRGDEAVLEDDPAGGAKVVPASVCLEMMRAALAHATAAPAGTFTMEARDLAWGIPFAAGRNKELSVALSPNADGSVDVDIYSREGEVETVHCQGRVVPGTDALVALAPLPGSEGAATLSVPLRLDPVAGPDGQAHVLHPRLVGSILRACAETDPDLLDGALVPVALQYLGIAAPCPKDVTAWVRHAAGAQGERILDIELRDGQGAVCVQLRGLALQRPAGGAAIAQVSAQASAARRTDAPQSATLAQAPVSQSRLQQELKESLAQALFMQPSDLQADKAFSELGLDSIVGVEWVNDINKRYGVKLAAARVYDYPNVAELAAFLYGELAGSLSPSQDAPAAQASVPALSAAPGAAAADMPSGPQLQQELRESLANALFMQAADIALDKPFIELGLDSIVGVEWINELNKQYRIRIPATRVYDYPNLAELAAFLAREIAKAPAPAAVSQPDPVAPVAVAPGAARPAVPAQDGYPQLARSTRALQPAAAAGRPAGGRIAVVGMSGRYPQAKNLGQFWENLASGRNAITEIPPSRWDVEHYYDPDPGKDGKMYCKWMGMLDDIDCFDPLFFRISPAEAEHMDPQHRLFLEEGYRAFEDAGYAGKALNNMKCGVYLGIIGTEYAGLVPTSIDITGNNPAIGAARIAYFLNLKGPAISIDTACSASLVAIHLACQGLLSGETDMALAGGVSVWLNPETYVGMCRAGMLSPEGQCKTFDDRANGFVPGEGVGAVVLKRLEDAERDNDVIHGVILGSAINQDGRTNGITAPSVNSQIELERELYARCGIHPETISYVETHGTGTRLGDPIELEALATVYKEKTSRKHFCALGSVKSNIGHTSGAAGVASVQKVLLCMKHRTLVPSLNVNKENTLFDFAGSPFYVARQAGPWQAGAGNLRRAAVSSFGFSGTNAHLVLEEYVRAERPGTTGAGRTHGQVMIPLSARTAAQLQQKGRDLLAFIDSPQGAATGLGSIAYTLLAGRDAMDERLAFVVDSVARLGAALRAWLDGRPGADCRHGRVERDEDGAVLLNAQEGVDDVVARCVAQRDLATLAQLWVRGLDLAWDRIEGTGAVRRASLPTYPFAQRRCWIGSSVPRKAAADSATAGAPASALHPLLERKVSVLGQQSYGSSFDGREPFLVDDAGQRVLPASAYLEMVRCAVHDAGGVHGGQALELRQLAWGRPLVAARDRQVNVVLFRKNDGEFDVEIYSLRQQGDGPPEEVVHCQTHAVLGPAAPARLDIAGLRRRIEAGAARGAGMPYRGEGQLLAQLSPTAAAKDGPAGWVLDPEVLAGALDAAAQLLAQSSLRVRHAALPFALASVRIHAACARPMLAWVRHAQDGQAGRGMLDVDLSDLQGNVCVQMRGLAYDVAPLEPRFAAPAAAPSRAMPAPVMLHPVTLAPAAGGSRERPHIVLDAPGAAPSEPAAAGKPPQITLS